MQWYVDQNILSCCNTLVMRGTDVLDFKTFGYMDLQSKEPLRPDAIYRMYSSTKLITSAALMMLFEEGRIGLDDALSDYLPGFAEPMVLKADAQSVDDVEAAHSEIVIRQVLSHSAGFSYGFIEPDSVIDKAYASRGIGALDRFDVTLEGLCDALATLPLAYQPGSYWRYSFATDVVARLIEVISGMGFDAFLKARIFDPLGMVDTDFWVPADKADRFVTMYAPEDVLQPMQGGLVKADDNREGIYNQPRAMLSGGGGLVSTVSDYLTFIRMIVAGGEWAGVRCLQPATLQLMRTNQLADGVGVNFPMWRMPGTVFGLGFALREELGPDDPPGAQGEYHWGGMAGTHAWMAPAADLTGMCMTQRMPGFWHPFSQDFKKFAYELPVGALAL
jgi:CubicO group peptidase (beta-lactamase class C family)